MARSPEGSGFTKRALIFGAAAAGAAAALHLSRGKKNDPDSEPLDRTPPQRKEKGPERVKAPIERGARSIFRDQIEKGQEPTFGNAEAAAIEKYWTERYKTPAGGAWIQESKARIGAVIPGSEPRQTYLQAIEGVFKTEGVPKKYLYLAFVESQFKTYEASGRPVRSRTGAIGAYQFQEGTAKEYGLKIERNPKREITLDERLDPVKAAGACARYLRYFAFLAEKKGATEDDKWAIAAYAYNGGFAQTYLIRNQRVSLQGFYQHMQQEMRERLRQAMSAREYAVKPGDTLLRIAIRNQTRTAALRKANPKANWGSLRVGTKITIPGLVDSGPVHTVQPNETLSILLNRYQLNEADVRKVNPEIKDWKALVAGTEIRFPPGSAVFEAHIKSAKLGLLSGYVENIDYVPKLNAVVKVAGV